MNTKKKYQAIGWALLAPLVLIIAAFGILWMVTSHNEKQFVLNQGSRTTGTITSRYLGTDDDGYDYATIKYTFNYSDQELTGLYTYDFPIPNNLNVGTQIEILYNPQKPSVNLPADARENERRSYMDDWPMLILVAIILCGLAVFLGYKARSAWKRSKPKKSLSQFH